MPGRSACPLKKWRPYATQTEPDGSRRRSFGGWRLLAHARCCGAIASAEAGCRLAPGRVRANRHAAERAVARLSRKAAGLAGRAGGRRQLRRNGGSLALRPARHRLSRARDLHPQEPQRETASPSPGHPTRLWAQPSKPSVIVPADSPAKTLADLKGGEVAFGDPASTSGTWVPRYQLLEAGLVSGRDYTLRVLGAHDAVALAVANQGFRRAAFPCRSTTGC